MIIFSALLSIPLAGRIVRPLLEVNKAVDQLSGGNYAHRLDNRRRDELGDLAGDINTLGMTLEKNLDARQRWIAEISHELRTPLAVMRAEIEAVQDGVRVLDEKAVNSLHAEVMGLGRLINDLHTLSMSDVGALNYQMSELDLSELLDSFIRANKSTLSQHEIECSFTKPDRSPLQGDAQRLDQLFTNLLQNTCRYTDSNGQLHIVLANVMVDGLDYLEINWFDSSPGVAASDLPQLFDPLFRTDGSRNREFGGSGLGLSIAKRIVEAHKGTISADNSSLGGLHINIRFPASTNYMSAEGYETDIFYDGAAALKQLKKVPPDFVLLDLMLPGTDGITLCRELRKTSNVPIIMITARVEEIDRLLGLEIGADDYICKPFSPREVVARVKTVLRRSSLAPPTDADNNAFTIDEAGAMVQINGQESALTSVELNLLKTLHSSPGRIFNRDQLMARIYPDNRVVSDRTIDSHVKKLRQKLEVLDADNEYIHSVYGIGYKFEWVS